MGRGRWSAVAPQLAALLLAVVVGVALLLPGLRADGRLDAGRVVVAGFENRTGDPTLEPVGDMAADWVTRGLATTGLADVVDARTALAASDRWRATPSSAADRIRAIAEETGAGMVVWGSYELEGDSLRLQAQVSHAATGELLRAIEPVRMAVESPTAGLEPLRRGVIRAVAFLSDREMDTAGPATLRPPTYASYRAMLELTRARLRGDVVGTLQAARELARLEPESDGARRELAEALRRGILDVAGRGEGRKVELLLAELDTLAPASASPLGPVLMTAAEGLAAHGDSTRARTLVERALAMSSR